MSGIDTFVVNDYETITTSRYTEQSKDDAVYNALIQTVVTYLQGLQETMHTVCSITDLQTATGIQLDVIGALLGQPRVLMFFDAEQFFGFEGSPDGQTFGDTGDSSVGGIYISTIQASSNVSFTMDDATYLRILNTKILANTSDCTPNEVLACINALTQTTTSILSLGTSGNVTIKVPSSVDNVSQYFLRNITNTNSLIPLPLGVRVLITYV